MWKWFWTLDLYTKAYGYTWPDAFQGSQGRLRATWKVGFQSKYDPGGKSPERMQYEEEWKVYNDYFNTLDFAEQKGVQKGLQKGKEETARNLKELGVADDIIIKSTGLSKEEIEKL